MPSNDYGALTDAISKLNIRAYRPHNSNYTPADLIVQWARENGHPYGYNRYGRVYVDIGGLPFAYLRWTITPSDEATDQIDVDLAQISAWKLT